MYVDVAHVSRFSRPLHCAFCFLSSTCFSFVGDFQETVVLGFSGCKSIVSTDTEVWRIRQSIMQSAPAQITTEHITMLWPFNFCNPFLCKTRD